MSELYEKVQTNQNPVEREKKVLILRYGLGDEKELPQRVIAERLGISRSYVSRIQKTAVTKLTKAFEEKGYAE